jgi:hypothetical protein
MRRSAAATLVTVVAAVICLGTLSGCSSSEVAPTSSPSPTVVAPTSEPNVPTGVPNVPAKRADVEITSCLAARGGWAATGKVTNSGTTSVSYAISVFFTTQTATVVGTARTKVTLPAGKTVHWSATAQIANAASLRCVLRGVG